MLFIPCVLFPFLLNLPVTDGSFTLKVNIAGASQKGNLMAELRNQNGQVVQQRKQNIKTGGAMLTFANLPKGGYAVAVFHDEDADGELDTNFVGIPTEAYGFSNNARGVFGPPELSEQLFELKTNYTITIQIR